MKRSISEEKNILVPLIFKHKDKILFKWNSKWNTYNFIGGKINEEENQIEDTVKRKIKEETGFVINRDCTYKKLSEKFLFTQNSLKDNKKWYHICHPYQLICLKEMEELYKILDGKNKELIEESKENPPPKQMLEWFSIAELSGAKPVNDYVNVLETSEGIRIAGAIVDILWNINSHIDIISENPVENSLEDISDSYDDILIKLIREGITIGTSERVLEMVDAIRKAVEDTFERPVMLLGEPGSGKSRIARAIHNISGRPGEFVSDTLSGVNDENFQCILFGYAPGSFSGALEKGADGILKNADGGTVFLDEITTIKKDSQSIFLKTLGLDFFEGATNLSFYRYGGRGTENQTEIHTNIRLISATNQNPVCHGNTITFHGFRDDLTSRLTDHIIEVPSLKELKGDRYFIVDFLLKKFTDNMPEKETENDSKKNRKDKKSSKNNNINVNKKRILMNLFNNRNIDDEDVKDFKLTLEMKDDVKELIFDGRYELSWNYRSLISIMAGAVHNAVKEHKIAKNQKEMTVEIEKNHLPVFKKMER